jgi:hypothetical protein
VATRLDRAPSEGHPVAGAPPRGGVERIWEGTSQIQRLIIANHVSKRGLEELIGYRAGPDTPPVPTQPETEERFTHA